MKDFIVDIGKNILFSITKGIEKKIDGRLVGEGLDKQADEKLGANLSEKIQRGPITNFIFEFLEGLYAENLWALVDRVRVWLNDLAYRAKEIHGERKE